MKKILFMLGMLFILFTSSYALTITPASINIQSSYGNPVLQPITLFNDQNFTIANITFSQVPNVTFAGIPNSLNSSQSAVVNLTSIGQNLNTNPTISFYYFTNTTVQPTQRNITISNTSFSPNLQNLNQNDTVCWTNIDAITHTATDVNGTFNLNIASNQTQCQTFPNQGTINYLDNINNFGGQLVINSNLQQTYTHNSAYDKQLPIFMSATYGNTGVALNIFLTQVTMNYNQAFGNALTLTNEGNVTARNLNISMQWLSINQSSNIFITPNTQAFMPFSIVPNITFTSQTNQSYPLTLTVIGDNIQPVSESLNVFINYANLGNNTNNSSSGNTTIIFATNNQIQAFCQTNPLLCPTTTVNQTVYVEKPQTVNITQENFSQIIAGQVANQDWKDRIENLLKEKIQEQIDAIGKSNDYILQQNQTVNKDIEVNKDTNWKITFLLVLLILALVVNGLIIGGIVLWYFYDTKWRGTEGFNTR